MITWAKNPQRITMVGLIVLVLPWLTAADPDNVTLQDWVNYEQRAAAAPNN